MSQTYFTADLHLGHDLVAEQRGFVDTVHHDSKIISQFLNMPKGSIVWILGDLERGSNRALALWILGALKSMRDLTLHLIPGNHDAIHPMHRRAHLKQAEYLEVFDSVQAFAKIRNRGNEILLSHFPYYGDHTVQQRYDQWRLRDYGMPLIHGHTHQDMPIHPDRPNQVCVSWDALRRPLMLHEVMEWLDLAMR